MTFTVEREFTPGGPNLLDKLIKMAIAAAQEEMRREAADTVHKHKPLCPVNDCALNDVESS